MSVVVTKSLRIFSTLPSLGGGGVVNVCSLNSLRSCSSLSSLCLPPPHSSISLLYNWAQNPWVYPCCIIGMELEFSLTGALGTFSWQMLLLFEIFKLLAGILHHPEHITFYPELTPYNLPLRFVRSPAALIFIHHIRLFEYWDLPIIDPGHQVNLCLLGGHKDVYIISSWPLPCSS